MLIPLLFIIRRRWPVVLAVVVLSCVAAVAFQPRGAATVADRYSASGFVAVVGNLDVAQIEQAILSAEQGKLHADALATLADGGTATPGLQLKAKLDDTSRVVELKASADTKAGAAAAAKVFTATFVSSGNGARELAQAAEVQDAQALVDAAQQALDLGSAADAEALAQDPPDPAAVSRQVKLQGELDLASTRLTTVVQDQDATAPFELVNVSPATLDVKSTLHLPASRLVRLVLGLVLGLLGAVGLVAFLEKLNPRIDDPAHAEEIIGAPVLAMVPVMGRRQRGGIERVDPATFSGPFAEAFRALRSYLDYRQQAEDRSEPARVIVVSASPGEGKSTTAAFLAYSYAEVGQKVIVIGGDIRRPSVHQFFGVKRTPGLSSLKGGPGGRATLEDIVTHDPLSGVSVVPSGPSLDRVTGLLGQLSSITQAGQRSGSAVVLDSAPVMVANDPIDFLPCVDWTLVVVRLGRSTERSVRRTVAALRLSDAVIVGCVLVGSMESSDAKRYYYNYYAPEDGGHPGRSGSAGRAEADPVEAAPEDDEP